MLASLLTLLLVPGQVSPAPASPPQTTNAPKVIDARLQLQLFAEAPQIVTPVSLAIGPRGRILCIESHTHFRPKDYNGPKTDRIQLLEDTDEDGRADRITTFYEGLTHTMGLAVYHDGSVYVATRSEILHLRDKDGDGKADESKRIAHLETAGNYPHNGLAGFAFDILGNVYFGFGENLGADYKLIGADGTSLNGGGEGGNIYRCGPAGEKLTRIATGFWNPFHLCFDAFGRLFAVDNDPDSRPPCRLLHIVEGGDYGYRFRNGRRGTHPFTSWNGEIPGTLPMVAGTGEAPSGIVAYESDNLPEEYRGDLLVTSWGDHRIERYKLRPRGASFTSEMQPVVVGGENFRPVGITLAPDGSIYFSDWVDKSYQLHGKGRIWRLSAKHPPQPNRPSDMEASLSSPHAPWREAAAQRLTPEQSVKIAGSSPDPRARSLAARMAMRNKQELQFVAGTIAALDQPEWKKFAEAEILPKLAGFVPNLHLFPHLDLLKEKHPAEVRAAVMRALDYGALTMMEPGFQFSDPFLVQAAAHSFSTTLSGNLTVEEKKEFRNLWPALENDNTAEGEAFRKEPRLRLLIATALRNGNREFALPLIDNWLSDTNPDVQFYGVMWIGEEKMVAHRKSVEAVLQSRTLTRQLFEACLATLERLDGRARKPTDEWRGENYIVPILLDEKASPLLKQLALRTLRPDHPELKLPLLKKLLHDKAPAIRLEAIRTLRESPLVEKPSELLAIANDSQRSEVERAEAVVGLSPENADVRQKLIAWACEHQPLISKEALRSLRGTNLTPEQVQQIKSATASHKDAAWRELADRVTDTAPPTAPAVTDLVAWTKRSEGAADPAAGERLFYHPRIASCYRCHEYNGRGARIGPDLTTIRMSSTKPRIVESIVQPSREIAPHFVPWIIETTEGQQRTGMYVGDEVDGAQRFVDVNGKEFKLKPLQIEQRTPSPKSIMPEGLAAQLTPQEFRDLIAFLMKSK